MHSFVCNFQKKSREYGVTPGSPCGTLFRQEICPGYKVGAPTCLLMTARRRDHAAVRAFLPPHLVVACHCRRCRCCLPSSLVHYPACRQRSTSVRPACPRRRHGHRQTAATVLMCRHRNPAWRSPACWRRRWDVTCLDLEHLPSRRQEATRRGASAWARDDDRPATERWRRRTAEARVGQASRPGSRSVSLDCTDDLGDPVVTTNARYTYTVSTNPSSSFVSCRSSAMTLITSNNINQSINQRLLTSRSTIIPSMNKNIMWYQMGG